MKAKIGLWIDHTKAVIVSIAGKKENIVLLESNVSKHFRSPAGKKDSNPDGRRNVTSDDIQERESTEHLNIYYDKVISYLRNAESIFIFGPGEPKGELVKRIKKNNLTGLIADIETVGKMTDGQIAAKVRSYFHGKNRREDKKTVTSHNMPDFHLSRRKTDII